MKESPKKIKYYRWDEVVIHNLSDDNWVVIHGNIFDLTRLIIERRDSPDLVS